MKIQGKEVIDSTRDLTIQITKQDVMDGAKKDAKACAAAVALKRTCHASKVRVHLSKVYVLRGKTWTRYSTPLGLKTEILAFDRGGKFLAGHYTLTAPPPSSRLDTLKKVEAKRRAKGRPKRRRPTKPQGVRGKLVADWE
jgi:hypothetical protein